VSWAIGYDGATDRDIGYGVPAFCDHPGCTEEIDRGLSYVCGGEPYGQPYGCGLYFCAAHLWITPRRPQRCSRCRHYRKPFGTKPDHPKWIKHKLRHPSWAEWRKENPEKVAKMKAASLGEKWANP
jgi:hypothetical protein